MRSVLRSTALHLGVFAGLLAAFWVLMLVSCSIPNSILQNNFESSAEMYKQSSPYQFSDSGKWHSITDNYADAILLGVSWHMGDGNPILATVNTRYNDGGDYGENYGLYLSVNELADSNTDYTRYWHGSAIFVRLLHLFTDVNGIKLIGFAMVVIFALLTVAVLIKYRHADIALMLMLSLICVHFWNLRLSLEYQPAFILTLLLCPMYLNLERKSDTALTLLSVAGGVSVAFFDFLTTETATLLLPLILVTAVRAKEGRLGSFNHSLMLILKCCIAWCGAYAAVFIVKWALASAVTGDSIADLALGSAAKRIVGEIPEAEGKMNSVFDALFANITTLLGGTERVQMNYVIIGTVLFSAILASLWYLLRAKEQKPEGSAILAILSLAAPLRYILLANHSYLHEFFTYRALISTILALLLMLLINIKLPLPGKTRSGGRR